MISIYFGVCVRRTEMRKKVIPALVVLIMFLPSSAWSDLLSDTEMYFVDGSTVSIVGTVSDAHYDFALTLDDTYKNLVTFIPPFVAYPAAGDDGYIGPIVSNKGVGCIVGDPSLGGVSPGEWFSFGADTTLSWFPLEVRDLELMQLIGIIIPGPPTGPSTHADAGGSYIIGPGQIIILDGSLSFSDWPSGPGDVEGMVWSINGKSIGIEEMMSVSYDTLITELGLGAGTYEVKLWTVSGGVDDYDYTTITIVPEPTTLLLLGLGAILMRKKPKQH
jgi:hypothetical protein